MFITMAELKEVMFDYLCLIYDNPTLDIETRDERISGCMEVFEKILDDIQERNFKKNGRKKDVQ